MRRVKWVLIILAVAAVAAGNGQGTFEMLVNALRKAGADEPDREGPAHNYARGKVLVVHDPSPAVVFVSPANGGVFEGYLVVQIANWAVVPEEAVPAGTEFANGHEQRNVGHTHTWIFDAATGKRVRFTGASGLTYDADTGLYRSVPFALPPGRYKGYVALQNHDHTPAIQANAQALPAVDTIEFCVME